MTSAPWLVVGEALVDVVVAPTGERSEAVGGSPMNVAVGLSRLGVPARLVTRIGEDAHGRAVVQHLADSGVELDPASVVPDFTTSTATATLAPDRTATYEFDLVWDLPAQTLPPARALHVGSLGASLHPGRDSVLDLVRQAGEAGLLVSYDPNVRPAFVTDRADAWAELAEMAWLASLVKVSEEDLVALRPGQDLDELAHHLLVGSTELVVVTHGGEGASAHTRHGHTHRAAPEVAVQDTVGAGDSFMAAALTVLDEWDLPSKGHGALDALDDTDLDTLLDAAMAAAATTCSRHGADPPTRSELAPSWPR